MEIVVFTSKYIIEQKLPVLYFVHDHDGDWQFLSMHEKNEEDGRILSLNEILKLDPSLSKIQWLRKGMEARRRDHSDERKTSVYGD